MSHGGMVACPVMVLPLACCMRTSDKVCIAFMGPVGWLKVPMGKFVVLRRCWLEATAAQSNACITNFEGDGWLWHARRGIRRTPGDWWPQLTAE